MLNCSEVECILHHDHYYHQLHQLQHHLQDGREHHEHAMSGEPEDTKEQTQRNDTDIGLQDVHLSDPNETVYMICGVLIAMVLVALIIVLLALTISKLRKRDDNQSPPPRHPVGVAAAAATTTTTTTTTQITAVNHLNCQSVATVSAQVTTTILPPPEACPGSTATTTVYPPQFLWQFPPPYSLYSNNQDPLVHTLPAGQPGICRGFRKNLRGRWRRLVKRKPANEVYTIPAELRDQLKQIYVY
ncbi:uncharacterized protein LOC126273306 isoform X1 [Schistocerca gregaria]|uniref:uncharacterized protein LOC126273306 isoform X1 n=2 Tax=Schistocerca gregaria TaxID=7010 RepID=UPI00211DD903|nr:uncharacterized protein LOC126273306 isoform X1 [Schistocerca gregaria]